MVSVFEAHDLCKSYAQPRQKIFGKVPRKMILKQVSLFIEQGECVALIGPSGSGKSTLAKLIVGLEKADAGMLSFCGQQATSFQSVWQQEIQLVFQNPQAALNPQMTIFECIAEPLRNAHQQQIDEKVRALLEEVGLSSELLTCYPSDLSGGQQQRVMIARALSRQPKLLILDEAVSSLDMMIRQQIFVLLKRLQEQRGLSYLFITHDLRSVEKMATRFYVLYDGEIVEENTSIHTLQHPFSKALYEAMLSLYPSRKRRECYVK